MVTVAILSSALIKPSPSTTRSRSHVIESCNLDLVVSSVHLWTLYFYAPQEVRHDGFPESFSPDVLKSSLAQALAIYYPMAGRLSRRGDGRIEIVCNDGGALFVVSQSDCSLQDLGTLKPKFEFLSLVPSLDSFSDEASQPIFLAQVTKFTCGGIALGIGVDHRVADGSSAIAFMNAWAALARGEFVNCSPCFDKVWLKAKNPPMPQYPHHEYTTLPPKPADESAKPLPNPAEAIDIPKEFVQELKQRSCGPDMKKPFSTYEVLSSHIWRCACKARNLPLDQKTVLVTVADGRPRLTNPSLPDHFFGNVVFTSCPTDSVGRIVSGDLTHTASLVRKALRKVDNAYCRSAIDFLELQNDPSKFVKGAHTYASPNLGLVSWSHLPIYETDFGWGKPIYIGPTLNMGWEGLAYILKSPSNDGSFRLFISLRSEHMPEFKKLILKH